MREVITSKLYDNTIVWYTPCEGYNTQYLLNHAVEGALLSNESKCLRMTAKHDDDGSPYEIVVLKFPDRINVIDVAEDFQVSLRDEAIEEFILACFGNW